MEAKEAERCASGCASSSAAAVPEGALRRRIRTRNSADGGSPELETPEKNSNTRRRVLNKCGSECKTHDGEAISIASWSRSTSEDAASPESATTSTATSIADPVAKDKQKGHTTEDKPSAGGNSTTGMQQPQPTGSRLLIEMTSQIRSFLEMRVAPKTRRELMNKDRIDLDVLQRLVRKANEEKGSRPEVRMAELVEASQIVERVEAPKISLDKLSFSERLRLEAEERRHQAAVRSLWGERLDRQDCFADINKSLAMGVNALLGIFLTFLGGYWASLYCGVDSLQTRVVVGLVCSIVCLVVEVLLFVIHDERQRLRAKKRIVLGPPLRKG